MTGRYDEWAAARTPSLLRFAHALVGADGRDPASADAAVRRALGRLEAQWDRVATRDDPDLVARAQVVGAVGGGQATRRRAAALLRLLEDRSDAEIADVLRCSESAARGHVVRGLSTVPAGAAAVPDTMSTSVQVLPRPAAPGPVEPPARRRRGGALVGAAAVVALVGGIAWADQVGSTPAGVITYPHVDAPTDWRVESYAGVQLQVPATWGFGGAPVRSDDFAGARRLGSCGSNEAGALSSADDASYASAVTPFVGRPAVMNERCVPWGADGVMPRTDAVWFGSPLPVGVKDVGSTVAETRAVGDQHVTVFASTSALRRTILGTVSEVAVDDNGCPARAVQQPTRGPAGLRPTSLSVCVYSQDTGSSVLMWSGRAAGAAPERYADAAAGAEAARTCAGLPRGRWVALGLQGDTGTRWDVVDLGCGAVLTSGGTRALTEATVRDWGLDGVAAYATAPAGLPPSAARYFRGG